jgi:undecaprenyl-diphosphatase
MDRATESSAAAVPPAAGSSGERWRVWAMVAGTLVAAGALLSQLPSLSSLWNTLEDATWWWVAVAALCTFGNKVGYALALMGSVAKRLGLVRSVEALIAAAFSNLAVPGLGGTAVQVRYLQLQGMDLTTAVAAGGILANVANVIVQGSLFVLALVVSSVALDGDAVDVDAVPTLLLVIALVGAAMAVAFGVPRFRRTTLPATRQGLQVVRTALRSPRQIALLVVGNLMAALMSALCLLASLAAYGGHVDYWPLLVANIVVGTVASLIPVPGGNTLVSAVGLSAAAVALGVPETAAVAGVLTQQLVSTYLPALPGWFATNDMLRHGML